MKIRLSVAMARYCAFIFFCASCYAQSTSNGSTCNIPSAPSGTAAIGSAIDALNAQIASGRTTMAKNCSASKGGGEYDCTLAQQIEASCGILAGGSACAVTNPSLTADQAGCTAAQTQCASNKSALQCLVQEKSTFKAAAKKSCASGTQLVAKKGVYSCVATSAAPIVPPIGVPPTSGSGTSGPAGNSGQGSAAGHKGS